MNESLETSKASGVHSQLNRLVGTWEGTSKTWFDPTKLEDESSIKGTMKLILNGRFILHEYEGSFGGQSLEGVAIYGYHLGLKKFQCAWVDSFHNDTAIMFSEGKRGEEYLRMLGGYSYVTPEQEQQWGWRTTIDIVSDDEIIITAFNISPEGEEAKATELVYKKVE